MLVLVSSLSVCEYERRIYNLTEVERREKENTCLGVALENYLPFIQDSYLLSIPRPMCGEDEEHSEFPLSTYSSIFPTPRLAYSVQPKARVASRFYTWFQIILWRDCRNACKVLEGSTLITATSARRDVKGINECCFFLWLQYRLVRMRTGGDYWL
jgi:hypothetical protein